jgi:hypothetical protein
MSSSPEPALQETVMWALRILGMVWRAIKWGFSVIKDNIAVLGFAVGILGFILTFNQFVNTINTLQATNAYAIQKDARDLALALQNDPSYKDYVLDHNPNKEYSDAVRADAYRAVGRFFNFYLSVFRQYEVGGISQKMADSFGRDFCGTMKSQKTQATLVEFWRLNLASNPDYERMRHAWCP